nr:hypothetical protein [uncultured Oscillibacter sp.]
MNDIPEVVEQLYYNWGTIPDPENWSEYIGKNPVLAQGLYSFYQGLCLGMNLSGARRAWEPLAIQNFLR